MKRSRWVYRQRPRYSTSMLDVFRSRKMAALMTLGFSSGLPLFLTQRTLQAWMTKTGVDLSTIGLFSLIGLPYSVKFLWSPFVDRFSFPFLGRRKGWIAVSQLVLAGLITVMASTQPASNLRFVATVAFLIALSSATLDITVDAYRADILTPKDAGAGTAVFVLGYRIALLLTGSVMLIVADHTSWPAAYRMAAVFMAGILILSLGSPEPAFNAQPPDSLAAAVWMPFKEFIERLGTVQTILVITFIITYRISESMIVYMATPFLLQTGFTLSDVGTFQSGLGLLVTIAGVIAGGLIITRLGIHRSLWIFGILQAASGLTYWFLALAGKNYGVMVGAIVAENACTGLLTAALVTFLVGLCNPRFSATQYALLSSVMAMGRDVVAAPAGAIAAVTGWPVFFLITFAAALPGLALLPFISKEAG